MHDGASDMFLARKNDEIIANRDRLILAPRSQRRFLGASSSARSIGASASAIVTPMPLHLIKLAVGADSLADLRGWMAERMADAKRRRAPLRHAHVTRMAPKRTEQVLDGGSLYWVVKGMISARQEIVGLEPFVDADGIGRCKIWLGETVVAVAPRPMRAFQGWRYYQAKDAPPDIDEAQPGFAAMPEGMRRELASLGLL